MKHELIKKEEKRAGDRRKTNQENRRDEKIKTERKYGESGRTDV